ncbi:hypothetical protein [Jejuia pallidilutea]|uniref:hypothetical protein n=1 Tax=Jejuia pallidilutea TaxID=504487 RepID=UPI0005A9AD1A|nr:hypothetical protein [Jejuia pallidilutea]
MKPELEKFCKSALKFVGLTLACWQAAIPLIIWIFFILIIWALPKGRAFGSRFPQKAGEL